MRLVFLGALLLLAGCTSPHHDAGGTLGAATRSVSHAGQPRPATNPASQTVRTSSGAAASAPGAATSSSSASAGARRAPGAAETVREAMPD